MDGALAGTWRHEWRGRRLRIQLAPFLPLPAHLRAAAEAQAEALAAWLGLRPEVRWEAEAPSPQ